MEGDNIYDKIRELFGDSPGTLSILEEKVDIDLQMEYFELSRLVKDDLDEEAIMREKSEIYNPGWTVEQKKRLLARLASIENVEAYRFIENYLKEGQKEIRSWALLALQESRMLLESKLLGENQVFISTGLGGRGSKLRYFVVLIRRDNGEFSGLHQKIVRSEFEFAMKRHGAEIESIDFQGTYATMLVMIPLKASLKDVFRQAIKECNQYGNFLKSNFIVTNVRELGLDEIEEFLLRQEQAGRKNNPDQQGLDGSPDQPERQS
jgi:hypothetical protein